MTIKMILAVDQGNALGWSDGRLAWRIPQDMRYFAQVTTGHTVIMGFNTFLSLGKPDGLPNRKNMVLTRKYPTDARSCMGGDVDVISSLDYIVALDKRNPDKELWIIGGASVYQEALQKQIVDELHVTFIHANSDADVVLPFDLYAWKRFVLEQRNLGVNWDMTTVQRPTVVQPLPGIDIVLFKKL